MSGGHLGILLLLVLILAGCAAPCVDKGVPVHVTGRVVQVVEDPFGGNLCNGSKTYLILDSCSYAVLSCSEVSCAPITKEQYDEGMRAYTNRTGLCAEVQKGTLVEFDGAWGYEGTLILGPDKMASFKLFDLPSNLAVKTLP